MGLEVQELTKVYQERIALDKLTFDILRPGVYGLIGDSGSGKTTAMRIMAGITAKDGGKILWNKEKLTPGSVKIGYLSEDSGIYEEYTVLDQLVQFARLHGMRKKAAIESSKELMKKMGMEGAENILAEKLPKSEKQKIRIMMALVHKPDLILLDEPFSGLDESGADALKKMIPELISEGKYIIMSSKQMEIAEKYCDNLLVLHRGKTILKGNLKTIKHAYGHTNLVIACDVDVTDTALDFGMKLIEKREEETEYRIQGEDMASALLEHMMSQGFRPTKYEIREPSLMEIYHNLTGEETIG